ncbi:hypothetical protein [Pseudodesulfovibrio pelocollis]|uniref:hypothetical protein n=1 Tax=Pseudodesulfovibrio pelocollis TaxID=3051432 RepID=UPI00255AB289|nr:hypothetical protein [Pseudodesulfovibrio sp. SB368]
MAFGQQDHNYGNECSQNQNNYEGNSIKLCWKDLAFAHLLKLSVVFQERPKDYKSPVFGFFSVWPKGNNTYIKDQHITFMLEIPKLKQLAEALNFAAIGRIPQSKMYKNWADSSKAATKANDTEERKGKYFAIYSVIEENSVSVSLTFSRGNLMNAQGKDDKTYKDIPILLNVAEAKAVAWYCDYFAEQARQLEFEFQSAGPMHIIRKKMASMHQRRREANQNNQQAHGSTQQGQQGQQGVQGRTQQPTQSIIPDQTLIMQAYPFLPKLDGVFFTVENETNGTYLKADGNIQNNLKALIEAGFQFRDGDPYWWRKAAA